MSQLATCSGQATSGQANGMHVTQGQVSETACAICFEQVDSIIDLPCCCKVAYCHWCWDRALAQCFRTCGLARCPTCRSPVHVRYDSQARRLVFVREEESLVGADAQILENYMRQTLERLAYEVLPRQIEILNSYAANHGLLQEVPGNNLSALVAERVNAGQEPPSCSCGAPLQSMAVWERIGAVPESIMCDVCGEYLPLEGRVWTCTNGSRTIMHAGSYDICEGCLSHHCRTPE